jgi:hypothetical protein
MTLTSCRDSGLRGHLPADVRGLQVALAQRPLATAPLVLHGAYRIPHADLEGFEHPIVRSLVLVTQRNLLPSVLSPFAEKVLFEDDQVRTAFGTEGAFTLDVFELLALPAHERAGHYHLFVSLGPHVSNVVEATVA